MMDGDRQILAAAIAAYGMTMQQTVAMEEMGELIQQLSKQIRGIGSLEHLAEEIADVQIMLDQLILMHRLEEPVNTQRANKIARLQKKVGGKEI